MRSLILFSSIGIILFLFFSWVFIKSYKFLPTIGKRIFEAKEFQVYGVDGALLKGTYTQVQIHKSKHNSLLIIISDINLDRNWDSPYNSFRTGHLLANYLASAGIESIRYDHRGTGKTIASTKTKHDFDLKVSDLKTIYDYAVQKSESQISFLAHGNNACSLLLYALSKGKMNVPKTSKVITKNNIILLSCGGSGNLLDLWLRKLFFNMERRGVSELSITQAKKEWNEWKKKQDKQNINNKHDNKLDINVIKVSADIIAFRSALAFLASDEMYSFYSNSKKIFFFSLLKEQLRKNSSVLHINCRYDEELSKENQKTVKSFANKAKSVADYYSLYRFIDMDACNHFLKDETTIRQGFDLSLRRMNPFLTIKTQILQEIRKHIIQPSKL